MQIQFLLIFIIYLLTILTIGFLFSKKLDKKLKEDDLILGGRSSNWLITALSTHASDMSDWLFMGLPASVYLNGIKEIWIVIGLIFGMFCSWQFIAKKIRLESKKYNSGTLVSYLKNRFKDDSGIIILLSSLIMFFFFIIYLSVGIKGIGYLLESTFNLDYYLSTLSAVIVIIIYIFAGFNSVSYIDSFQGIFLLLMLIIVPIYALIKLKVNNIDILNIFKFKYLIKDINLRLLNQFPWFLGYFGMPHILTKFMAIKDVKDINKSKYFGLTWQFLALFSAFSVGIIGSCYFKDLNNPELIFIDMTKSLFNPWITAIILCAILSATISTIDSQLITIATTFSYDIYKNLINKNSTEKELNNIYKISIIVSGFIALLIAWQKNNSIMGLVQYSWSGLGSSFGPSVLLALYSKKINRFGIIASIITGLLVSIFWNLINNYIFSIKIYSILPAFVLSILFAYIVSFLTKNKI